MQADDDDDEEEELDEDIDDPEEEVSVFPELFGAEPGQSEPAEGEAEDISADELERMMKACNPEADIEQDAGTCVKTCIREDKPGDRMIGCDGECGGWFHLECVDMEESEIPDVDEDWVCPMCSSKTEELQPDQQHPE